MKIDLHCHSKYSHDSDLDPEVLIEEAIGKNLDGVCFMEHDSIMASKPVENIRVPEDFSVFRGVEIATDHGHLLVYGLKNDAWNVWFGSNYLDLFQVIETVHKFGGICVLAHPYRRWDSPGDDILVIDGLDAIETHNGLNLKDENQRAIQLARMQDLPSVGGSDCHTRDQVGRAFTAFENPVKTIGALIEEIRKGNCRGKSL